MTMPHPGEEVKAQIELRLTAPAAVQSPAVRRLHEEHPEMTLAELHAEVLRRTLGGWWTVEVVSDPERPADQGTGA